MMDILHTISEEQQVIVFSQELETMRWAQEHLVEPRDRLVALHCLRYWLDCGSVYLLSAPVG